MSKDLNQLIVCDMNQLLLHNFHTVVFKNPLLYLHNNNENSISIMNVSFVILLHQTSLLKITKIAYQICKNGEVHNVHVWITILSIMRSLNILR